MVVIKDDWGKPRSNGTPLTAEEIKRVRTAFNQGRHVRDIARELQCSRRTVDKYYAEFRGRPNVRHKPLYRQLIHAPKPAPAAAQSRFYKSNFEI
jgi:DNA invertase Pin-like site-specific DNA recombinase